jgi:plasmid stability protein
MATLTIRNVPESVADRLKEVAAQQGRSMEEEVRLLLQERYVKKEEILRRIEERWRDLPKASSEEVEKWIREGRE